MTPTPEQIAAGRLTSLKRRNVIAGFEAPHPNRGLAGGMLPWVVMPYNGGPSSTYYALDKLMEDIAVLERMGPTNFVLGGSMCRYSHGACD